MLGNLKSTTVLLVVAVMGLALVGNVYGKQKNAPGYGLSAGAEQKKASRRVHAPRKTTPPLTKRDGVLDIKSNAAIVVEQWGGDTLFQKNASAIMPIASITKLMMAMVVLDDAPDMQETVQITDNDIDYLRGTRSRLYVGAGMTRKTALLLALMSSENRAAHALARHYPGGRDAFLLAMNEKATALGMHDTHFDDPTGLSNTNVSTARDLAKMVEAAYSYPVIREFSTMPRAIVGVNGRPLIFHNTNPLVRNTAWDIDLSKTGYIREAGKCLVMQARVKDRPVVIVLLDSAGKQTRMSDANRIRRWMETSPSERAQTLPVNALDNPG